MNRLNNVKLISPGEKKSFESNIRASINDDMPTSPYDSEHEDMLDEKSSDISEATRESLSDTSSFHKYDSDESKQTCKILNGREARNRAEKNRRDKLNSSIQELSGMVPHVSESPRRVDKTAVLRFSAHGLRVNYVFGKTKPAEEEVKQETSDTLFRMLDGFLLTVTCRGQIVLVSPTIEQFLGHCQLDLYGQSILNITHPDDHALLKQQLIPTDLSALFDATGKSGNEESQNQRTKEEEEEIDQKLRLDRRNFTVRFAKAGPRSEPTQYELVRINGCFRRADSAPRGTRNTAPTGLQLIRRTRGRDDGFSLHSVSGNDIILIAMARIVKAPKICDRLIEACKYEYKTRHLIDGRIVQCDQRISIVAGYLTDEVQGLSAFTFMHRDDVRWVMVALRQMYDYNKPSGESCYRLISRTGDFIYLKTSGYLEVDDDTKTVRSFVCINTLVPEDVGKQLIRDMKRKFSVIVNQLDKNDLAKESDVPAVENPQQIERAIMNLITNLYPSQPSDDQSYDDDRSSISDIGSPASVHQHHDRKTKTPPLAIIAPQPSTIKPTITKSIDVIVAATKNKTIEKNEDRDTIVASPTTDNANLNRPSVLQRNPEPRIPPLPNSDGYFTVNSNSSLPSSYAQNSDICIASNSNSSNSQSTVVRTSSVLKRTYAYDEDDDNGEHLETNKKRNIGSNLTPYLKDLIDPKSNLIQVLPTSLEAIDDTLSHIEKTTLVIRSQVSSYPDLPASQRLDSIMEEQNEQREILQSIQQEYQSKIQIAQQINTNGRNNNNNNNENEKNDCYFNEGNLS